MVSSLDFPLPIIWHTQLSSWFLATCTPYVKDGSIIARCGEKLICFATKDGIIKWEVEIHPRSGSGSFLFEVGGCLLTEYRRRPEQLSSVAGFNLNGQELWRTDFATIIRPGSTTLIDNKVYILGHEDDDPQFLYILSPETGNIDEQIRLEWAASALIPWQNELLLRSQTAYFRRPGLYSMKQDGSSPKPILYDEVWQLIRSGDYICTVARPDPSEPRILRIHDSESLETLISKLILTEAAALDGDSVFFVGVEGERGVLVRSDIATGKEHWRSSPLPEIVSTIDTGDTVVICYHIRGTSFYNRHNGDLIGETNLACSSPAIMNSHLYISAPEIVICADLPS
jgi:outer membrane protein assembly factor BamB